MERFITVHVERLPDGLYLVTSDELQGLLSQGTSVSEALDSARGVANKLIEAKLERNETVNLRHVGESFDYPLVISL